MKKKTGFILPVFSAVALIAVGLALAVFLPLPEERAFNALSMIKLERVDWNGLTSSTAVEKLNGEIEKRSQTPYRLMFADGANNYEYSFGEMLDISVTDYATYVADVTGNRAYKTPQGIVFDQRDREGVYQKPSWRRDLRNWIRFALPAYWDRWRYGPPDPSPFAPTP